MQGLEEWSCGGGCPPSCEVQIGGGPQAAQSAEEEKKWRHDRHRTKKLAETAGNGRRT